MLELDEICVRYRGLAALDRVSMTFEPGLVTGVIGPNGAGKSTLFNVASGFETPSSGSVWLSGAEITRMRPELRARRGLARTFQRLELFRPLTVRQNVMVAALQHHHRSRGTARAACDAAIERLGLTEVVETPAGLLSAGTGRMVELARALVTDPTVLLLDEPASGQDEAETLALDDILRALAEDHKAIALVEHDLSLVMRVCDRIYVLDRGVVIASGAPDEVQRNPRVQAAYLGAVA